LDEEKPSSSESHEKTPLWAFDTHLIALTAVNMLARCHLLPQFPIKWTFYSQEK
jgi:hypothetical protein